MPLNDKPIRVGFLTIGCRANQADTARMISSLHDSAFPVDVWSGQCETVVVNTCAVTSRAEADARKLIRRARRANPSARIIVTGCAAQVEPDKWISMPEVDRVIGISQRDHIDEFLHDRPDQDKIHVGVPSEGVSGPTPLQGHRSRPFLKIQDGCSRGCTYCIVPRARGPERSRSPELIREDISRLSDAGYREIVFTGIHLGRWGCDLGADLNTLLDILETIDIGVRFRLSSLEPMDLTPALVRRILEIPSICPHLHIPLQSGDQHILDAMGRGHTLAQYAELIETAVNVNPDTALGTDIMVGFPGEDDLSHQNSLEFIKHLPTTYLHVFTFSPRPLTPASEMPGRPRGPAVHARMTELRELDNAKRHAFREAQNGKIRQFLIEIPPHADGRITALSDNYLRVGIEPGTPDIQPGQLLPLRIDTNDTTLDCTRMTALPVD